MLCGRLSLIAAWKVELTVAVVVEIAAWKVELAVAVVVEVAALYVGTLWLED